MEEIFKSLENLEKLRENVPTFIFFAGIDSNAYLEVRKQLADKIGIVKESEIDIILDSPGGSAPFAYRLIRTFRERYETVNVIVPFWTKSAATLFAFGASKIVMHECGELGPIDAQIKKDDDKDDEIYSSALEVQSSLQRIEERSRQGVFDTFTGLRAKKKDRSEDEPHKAFRRIGREKLAMMLLDYSAKFYAPLLNKIDTAELGKMGRALEIGAMYAKRILKQYTKADDDQIDELLNFLVYRCPEHGYIIDHPLIKTYLPNVIKANESPFGDEYYKELGKLSLQLIIKADAQKELSCLGFLKQMLEENKKIKEERSKYEQSKQPNSPIPGI